MTCFTKLILGIPLVAVAAYPQSKSFTYRGNIVNARCMQAAIVNRNSRGYVPLEGIAAFSGTRHENLNTRRMRKDILRHCSLNPGVTEFALLDTEGNFLKLDDAGNFKVLAQVASTVKKVTATIVGNVDRERLTVLDLTPE